jgi:DNA-binding response OmpR family regulator
MRKARILSVSYDELLLHTRHLLLERDGYDVVSSIGFTESLEHCKRGGFDLFILGHSIPHSDKQELVETFRRVSKAPIISLRRSAGEQLVPGADYHIEPDPEPLLNLASRVLGRDAASA